MIADASFLDQTFDCDLLLHLIDKHQVFVAESTKGVSIGFIIISEKSGCAYIEEVDVLREHGQKGVGKALIECSLNWAREHGYKKMLLRTASNVPWNAPMYARFGFTQIENSNWSEEMETVHTEEETRGLPVADRIFMELPL